MSSNYVRLYYIFNELMNHYMNLIRFNTSSYFSIAKIFLKIIMIWFYLPIFCDMKKVL